MEKRAFLVEAGKSLLGLGLTAKQVELIAREAIHNADYGLTLEARGTGWTSEDTHACCVGMCAQKIGFDGQRMLTLKPFADVFDTMLTERYGRRAGALVSDARRIRSGIVGAFQFNK